MRFSLLLMAAALIRAETGSLTIHMILHAVGEERYEIASADGGLKLSTTFEYTDRSNKRTTAAELRMKSDYTPLSLEVQNRSAKIDGPSATVKEYVASRTFATPEKHFIIFGSSPLAVQRCAPPADAKLPVIELYGSIRSVGGHSN